MRKKKRILIVIHLFEMGGAERQAYLLAKGLKDRGHSVFVRGFGKEGSNIKWFRDLGIDCEAFGFREKLLLRSTFIKQWLLKKRYLIQLIFNIQKLRVDFIIPFTYYPNLIFCSYWRWMGTDGCIWNQRDEGRLINGDSKDLEALNNASEIISNSLEGRNFLERFICREVKVIPNGVDVESWPKSHQQPVIKKVGMIANLHGYKDHHTLLKAWAMIQLDPEMEDIKLSLAGREGDTATVLRKETVRLGIIETVIFEGEIKNIPEFLSKIDIGVFSSLKEGLPNGILECMASGLPVVASRIPGSVEALGEDYPFYFEPADETGLALRLIMLFRDYQARLEWGAKNRMRVGKNFGVKKMVDAYENLILSNT